MNKLIFTLSILSNFIIIYALSKKTINVIFLFAILAFSGQWLSLLLNTNETFFFSYAEFIVVLYFIAKYHSHNTLGYKLLAFFPLSCLLSLSNVSDGISAVKSIFYITMLLGGTSFFIFFKEKIREITFQHYYDKIVLLWTLLGVFYKVSNTIAYDTPFLLMRSGSSLWASNHQALIILILVPLVKNRIIKSISILFILFHLSRGIYLTLFLYTLLELLIYKNGQIIKGIIKLSLAISISVSIIFFINPNIVEKSFNILSVRLTLGGAGSNYIENEVKRQDIKTNTVIAGVIKDDRFVLAEKSVELLKESNYMGVGAGNFRKNLPSVDFPPVYSNAHNMYLTILSENGVIALFSFAAIMIYFLSLAFLYNRKVFIALCLFSFYGLFSGQIYEEGTEISFIDYYFLILLFAIVESSRRLKRETIST